MFSKILTLFFSIFFFIAANKAEAVFNGEEERPGLREEVFVKQEAQIAQGEVAQIMKQHAPSSPATSIQTTPSEKATNPSQPVLKTISSSWISWVQSAVLLVGGIAVFYWMIKAL